MNGVFEQIYSDNPCLRDNLTGALAYKNPVWPHATISTPCQPLVYHFQAALEGSIVIAFGSIFLQNFTPHDFFKGELYHLLLAVSTLDLELAKLAQ